MATNTTNYNLVKQDEEEFYDVNVVNANLDKIDTAIKQVEEAATNINLTEIEQSISNVQQEVTAHKGDNVYLTLSGTNTLVGSHDNVTEYKTGMLVGFKNTTQNTGAVTININGLGAKSLRKSNGTNLTSGNLKANGVYQARYDGSNFFLLGEGGEYGTAIASDVLSGKTIGTDNGLVTGTIVNRGAATFSPSTSVVNIPDGYYIGAKILNSNVAKVVKTEIVIDGRTQKPRYLYPSEFGLTKFTAFSMVYIYPDSGLPSDYYAFGVVDGHIYSYRVSNVGVIVESISASRISLISQLTYRDDNYQITIHGT